MPTHFVSFIGSGNVAWHLAPAFDNAGFVVKEVYSRNPQHAEALTSRLYQAEVKATLDFSTSDSTLFVIAASDDVVESIVQEIILPDNAILIHTSGSLPLSVLQFSASTHLGVFYPLQTFSQSRKTVFKSVPIFVESNDDETGDLLMQLAESVSGNAHWIDSDQRKALHIAAVFASNFVNHMLDISEDILVSNNLDFSMLAPLITETISKSLELGPEQAQTGPARRGDMKILDDHMEFLKGNHELPEIYKVISQHIVDKYS